MTGFVILKKGILGERKDAMVPKIQKDTESERILKT